MNKPLDKNGKEIKVGDLIIYSKWLSTVYAITDSGELQIMMKEFDNLIIQIMIKNDRKKIEVVTEQEAILFLLKKVPDVFQ